MSQQDEDAVLAANRAFYDAFEKLDPAEMGRVWSDVHPVSCIHPSGDVLVGRAKVMESWQQIFRSTTRMRFIVRSPRALVAGDTAWVILVEDMEAQHDEARIRARTRATNVFVREHGVWKLLHHHAEPAAAAKPSPASPLN